MGSRRLSAKQLGVIEELAAGKADTEKVLKRHRVGAYVFSGWLKDEMFVEAFRTRIDFAMLQQEALAAKCISAAIRRLRKMTASDDAEAARAACTEIMSAVGGDRKAAKKSEKKATEKKAAGGYVFPAETMQRVRAILADARRNKADDKKIKRESAEGG
jgi:HD-like signal output (HDOD) protein